MTRSRLIFGLALALGLLAVAAGLSRAALWQQQIWTATGWQRLLLLVAAFWGTFAIASLRSRRLAWVLTAFMWAVYSIASAGVAALFSVVVVFLAAASVGSLIAQREPQSVADVCASCLVGLALFSGAISVLVFWPVNRPAVYWMLLFAILVSCRHSIRRNVAVCVASLRAFPATAAEHWWAGLLSFALLCHWLVALKPEVGFDALSMHLAIPASVAQEGRWGFDVSQFTWAVMPMGANWLFTLGFITGGEIAARLLNACLLPLTVLVISGGLSMAGVNREQRLLGVALFSSTPIFQLLSGNLFAENYWMAMLAGAWFAALRFRASRSVDDLLSGFVLLCAACSAKLLAFGCAVPICIFLVWTALRRRVTGLLRPRIVAGVAAAAVIAGVPYVNAWWRTGNPVFPHWNSRFHSPMFSTTDEFSELRFREPLAVTTLFDLTFHSSRYFEGQDGAAGFQYLAFLPAGLIAAAFLRWRAALVLSLAVALCGTVLVFQTRSNLRYLAPVLPFAAVLTVAAIAGAECTPRLRRFGYSAAVVLYGLNICFLATADWQHKEFWLMPGDAVERAAYVARHAPERSLVEALNRLTSAQGAAFFWTAAVAGSRPRAFVADWLSYPFLRDLRSASSGADLLAAHHERGITHVIAPARWENETGPASVKSFLSVCADPLLAGPRHVLAALRPLCLAGDWQGAELHAPSAQPGQVDDFSRFIVYDGAWHADRQFPQARNHTITYSSQPGSSLRLHFVGQRVTWIHTKAANRGIADVSLDGRHVAKVDLFGAVTAWQAEYSVPATERGPHTLSITAGSEHNRDSSGTFVDVDAFVVE